jgi:hypothetical protein
MTDVTSVDAARTAVPDSEDAAILPIGIQPVDRLERDVKRASALIDADQARALVTMYYDLQEHRIALANQTRALVTAARPAEVVDHFSSQVYSLERQMIGVLDEFSTASEVGRWARAQRGIGPVLAAGLLAHIDIERAQTAGAIWRFAGLDPTIKWGKGEKRPYNAALKVLCWKIGDSFVKQSGYDNCFYGKIYRERKAYEVARDERGDNAATAADTLATRTFKDAKVRKVYESGHLPPGRLDLRARRYAVKLFLAHYHEVAFKDRFGIDPPLPYALGPGGHAHKIEVPPGEAVA